MSAHQVLSTHNQPEVELHGLQKQRLLPGPTSRGVQQIQALQRKHICVDPVDSHRKRLIDV